MHLAGTYDLPTRTKLATAGVGRVGRWSIGPRFKTATLLAVDVTSPDLDQTTADRNAMPVTSDVMANSGYLVNTWMNTTARDTARRCTACHKEPMNLQNNNMKIISNTTKATLRPYSQDELNEIAANVLEYQKKRYKDYAYTNDAGQLWMQQAPLWSYDRDRLYVIAKDLYHRGACKQDTEKEYTLKVIGQTIC